MPNQDNQISKRELDIYRKLDAIRKRMNADGDNINIQGSSYLEKFISQATRDFDESLQGTRFNPTKKTALEIAEERFVTSRSNNTNSPNIQYGKESFLEGFLACFEILIENPNTTKGEQGNTSIH